MRKWFNKVKHFAMPLCLLFALLVGIHAAYAQDATITGRVSNEKGQFMAGATVMEVGTNNRSEERRVGKECRFRW